MTEPEDRGASRAPDAEPPLVGAPFLARTGGVPAGTLSFDGVPLDGLAGEVGTPCFVYAARAVDAAFDELDGALSFAPRRVVAYAMKANASLALLARLAGRGCGADIVSVGELEKCLRAGVDPNKIVFSGVAKRDDEYRAAMEAGIRIHLESAEEIPVLAELAQAAGKRPRIALRVNPDVDAETHPYIATGLADSKFGLTIPAARQVLRALVDHPALSFECVACHIGSQLPTPAPLEEATTILARFARECREAGAPIRAIDVGGGFPIPYGREDDAFPPTAAYAEAVRRGLQAGGLAPDELELIVEPGRSLVGNAGVLLTRVLFVKDRPPKRFLLVDAGMTELIRPALYDAHHEIYAVRPSRDAATGPGMVSDVVGPVCETGDFFAIDRRMPPVVRGDLLAIASAGAYGMTMSSRYNARLRPPEVLVEDGRRRVVRRREPMEALFDGETL
jgi:diaminopimelate decarboxylase